MSSSLRRFLVLALSFAAGRAGIARGQAITEFPLPSPGGGPGDITAGPDGNLWFVASRSDFVGRITTDGVVTEFPLPTAGSSPSGIVAGSDGNLWFTEGGRNRIGRITTGGDITEFSTPSAVSVTGRIVSGVDGNLWFSEQGNRIGRITTAGVVTEFPVPSESPKGMTAGPDGNVWFTLYYSDKIGRITPSGVVTEYSVTPDSWPRDITAGPDGNLWFVTSASTIGRMRRDGHLLDEFRRQGLTSPNRIVAGPDGNLWFTEGAGNRIARITPDGDIYAIPVPTVGSSPSGIALGPDGNLWFTEGSGRSIGRVVPSQLPSSGGPCVADATTLCLNGGRFQVRADWHAPSLDTSGHGKAIALTGDTGFFWFFQESSIEVVVKVLDACSLNGHSWVFAGGLTDVGVTLTVTDTQTGVAKTYANSVDAAFQPIQDTSAFSTCP